MPLMADSRNKAVAHVRDLIAQTDSGALTAFLEPLHAADIAEVLDALEQDEQVLILKHLGTEKAAEVLTEVDEHSGQALLALLSDTDVVSLLGEMPSDDAVDIITALPPEKSKQVDALLPSEERKRIHDLMEFEEDTAGGIMEIEKVAVREYATVQDAIELVRALADEIENLEEVYVVDRDDRLVGEIPVLDLLLHKPSEKVTDVMNDNVITVPVEMDQEEVAALFGKYDEFVLPVVDAVGKLVGRITVDDIIDVLEEEASEDIARIVGTQEDEIGERSPIKISKARLPWLVIAMFGQLINALIMRHYTVSIETFITLVFFIPLVIGTAGSTGIQAAVVVVREIALGQVVVTQIGRRVFREVQVTLMNGLVLGVILFGIVYLWLGDVGLGLLLLTTLVSVSLTSALMGTVIPLALNRTRIDPAIATGPFITVLSDIVGLVIYLAYATFYLS